MVGFELAQLRGTCICILMRTLGRSLLIKGLIVKENLQQSPDDVVMKKYIW